MMWRHAFSVVSLCVGCLLFKAYQQTKTKSTDCQHCGWANTALLTGANIWHAISHKNRGRSTPGRESLNPGSKHSTRGRNTLDPGSKDSTLGRKTQTRPRVETKTRPRVERLDPGSKDSTPGRKTRPRVERTNTRPRVENSTLDSEISCSGGIGIE